MLTYDLTEKDNQFSQLIERAAKGEPLVINKNGKPVAKVLAIEPESGDFVTRTGVMKGQIEEPDEFDREAAKAAVERIIANRKGKSLGGLKIRDLIDEGRP